MGEVAWCKRKDNRGTSQMLTFLAVVAVIIFVIGGIIALGTNDGLGPSMVVLGILLLLIWSAIPAKAHDSGQWQNNEPAITEWYKGLMQPDVPNSSCCGEADAYWCDDYYGRSGRAFCKITDDRSDEPRRRPHIDVGTEFEIPQNKLKFDRSNPTGHGIIFLSRQGYVYCFVQPTGI
jgi:hypothetical protein